MHEDVATSASGADSERVLVLAPPSVQADLLRQVEAAGLVGCACDDLHALTVELAGGAGALLLTEEAISGDVQALIEALWPQPQWSDVPTILLARTDLFAGEGTEQSASAWAMERLGNVTVLDASLRSSNLASALRAAIRSRRRQYQLRDKIAELHRSEERFRLVTDAVSESVWDVDIATGRTWISESMRSAFGDAEAEREAHEDAWRLRQHPDDRARVAAEFQRVLAGGGTDWTVEYRLQKSDGSFAHVLDRARILRDASGTPVRIVGATLDISERKQAEEARARLAAIVESSDDAIVSKSLDGTILSWNSGAERLFGYRAEEAIGQHITLVIPPERHSEETAILERIARGQRVEHFETVRRSKRGRELYVSLTISPVRDAAGRIIGASKVARDVTARRLAEETLRKQSQGLRLLWESASALLTTEEPGAMMRALFDRIAQHIELDALLHFVPTDHGDAMMLGSHAGITEEDARAIARLPIHESACGRVAQTREPIVASHVQDSQEPLFQLLRSNRVRAYFCTPLVAEGRLLGTLSFGSRRRDAFGADELEFLQTISHYVTIACERWRLLEELRNTDRRKDEFLATLAHELRNPLAPIRNALQIMALSDERAGLEHARTMMERQLGQLVRLIDDLLDVSRITMGKLELRKERVTLASILESAVETSLPLIEGAGHTLHVAATREPVYLDADPVRLAQVFSNLLNNAAKYTERGGRIDVEIAQHGGEVVVTVSDTGTGIPPEALPGVFDMFAQVDRSLERTQGGLGIGLTLVKRLVDMHGGRVEVRSEGRDKGTQVSVTLSVVAASRAAEARSMRKLGAGSFRFRILVADDNIDAADSLAMMLRMMGNQVRTVHDGAQAIQEAEAFRPDLLLLDIGMPRVSGYDAARRIRAQRWGAGMVLVALTGWGQDEDKRLAREAGFDRHFTKPVSPSDLEKLLSMLSREPRDAIASL
jgi:PAS domain S-box-containing protein